jgi:hypothetical protein
MATEASGAVKGHSHERSEEAARDMPDTHIVGIHSADEIFG